MSKLNKKIVVSGLVAIFVLAGLASPAIAQASTDAVLVMHFDEGSGTIAKDASGYGNDGTIYGATWTTGISGKALQFDGVDDYVSVTSSPSLDITGEITIETWAKSPAPMSHNGMAIAKRDAAGIAYMFYWSNAGGALRYLDTQNRVHPYHPSATACTSPDTWYHFVATIDSSNTLRYYINGIPDSNSYSLSPRSSCNVDLGINGDYVGDYFKGIIDEVAIYNRALSPEEINAHYLAKRAGGSTEESASELINSVSTRIDVLKRNNVDTSLIEQALKNAQDAYDLGNHDEAYELAQSALKMADDAYEAQQHIESAQTEIDDAESIGAEVKDAENKLEEAKDALNKGNYEYARNWAADASELARHASIGSVKIKDLKALATKYDERTVVISGTIRDIETVYGKGYTFALDDGSGMISVVYQGSLGDIKDGDKVTASGVFQASTGTVVADNVQKSGVGGGVPGFEAIFAIVGLLAMAYLLRRR